MILRSNLIRLVLATLTAGKALHKHLIDMSSLRIEYILILRSISL